MKSLRKYINESSGNIKHDDLGHGGVFYNNNGALNYITGESLFYLIPTKDCIEISSLAVYKKRVGDGTALLQELIKFANSKNKTIVVYAYPLGDWIDEDNLINFYVKNGFVHDDRINDNHCLIYNS